ncbi:MAG: hypothetical protein JWR68_3162 [Polaromonas sp.]|nr:hypothetical protein [Polaromonas sp.]
MRSEFPPATARQIVPWRTLAVLAVVVLLAHALVLQTRPARFGPAPAPALQRPPAFATRSIALPPPTPASPPPAPAAPPASPAPQPAAKAVKKPVLKKKVPVAQIPPAPPAIESVAEPIQPPVAAEAPPELPATDGTLFPAAADAPQAAPADSPAATAAEPAASAPAAPPPQPEFTPVTAMALPASVQLDYKMTGSAKGLTYHAKGELVWLKSGDSYSASMTAKALFLGARTLSSTGQVSEQGLAPTRFSDKSRNEVAAHFEPEKGQISFSANTPAVPWTPGAQDRMSVFLQLGGMLAGNPAAFPVGATISLRTVGPRDADTWTFLVEREEQLSLPFGDLATVKVSRQPRREYDQKVEIWYAPVLSHLPVRNRITQANGDFVDQQLSALKRP